MTIPTTYATLQTAIEEDLARSDLTAELPNFINKGEAILNRRLRLLSMETKDTSTQIASGAETMALPDGYLEHINMRYTSDDDPLSQVGWDDLDELKSSSTGRPNVYAVGANFEFDRTTDKAYSVIRRYFKKWDIAADTTNTLLTDHPDIYVHAGLVGSLARTGSHPRAQGWVDFLNTAVKDLKRLDSRTRRQRKTRVDTALSRPRRFDIRRGY